MRAWLAVLDERDLAEANAVRDDVAEWRRRKLDNMQELQEFSAVPGHGELYEQLRAAVTTEAQLRCKASLRTNSVRERQRQQRKSLRATGAADGQGRVIHASWDM